MEANVEPDLVDDPFQHRVGFRRAETANASNNWDREMVSWIYQDTDRLVATV
jgi:hypothetical protein